MRAVAGAIRHGNELARERQFQQRNGEGRGVNAGRYVDHDIPVRPRSGLSAAELLGVGKSRADTLPVDARRQRPAGGLTADAARQDGVAVSEPRHRPLVEEVPAGSADAWARRPA